MNYRKGDFSGFGRKGFRTVDGDQPDSPKKKFNGKILGIVIAAVVVLVQIGRASCRERV